jgi:hypothetical protein
MVEDRSDGSGVGDEGKNFHFTTALRTGQRVDLVDAVNEFGPSFVGGSARRNRFVFVVGANLVSVGSSHAIGVGAIEMNQMFVGLGDVCEHPGQKLEWVGQNVIVELVSGLGLVDEQAGVPVEPQSRKVDGRAHEIAGELVQPFGVRGIDGSSIVDAEAGMSPRHEQVDAFLGNEPSVSEQGEELVSEEELGLVFVDVRNREPLAVGSPDTSGGDGVDVGIPPTAHEKP